MTDRQTDKTLFAACSATAVVALAFYQKTDYKKKSDKTPLSCFFVVFSFERFGVVQWVVCAAVNLFLPPPPLSKSKYRIVERTRQQVAGGGGVGGFFFTLPLSVACRFHLLSVLYVLTVLALPGTRSGEPPCYNINPQIPRGECFSDCSMYHCRCTAVSCCLYSK